MPSECKVLPEKYNKKKDDSAALKTRWTNLQCDAERDHETSRAVEEGLLAQLEQHDIHIKPLNMILEGTTHITLASVSTRTTVRTDDYKVNALVVTSFFPKFPKPKFPSSVASTE